MLRDMNDSGYETRAGLRAHSQESVRRDGADGG